MGKYGQCKGYKKVCWISSDTLCGSCQSECNKDIINTLIDSINNNVFSQLTQQSITDRIVLFNDNTLDRILGAAYLHARTLFKEYIHHITQTPKLKAAFFIRIMNHLPGELCSVYSWGLRNHILMSYPTNCIHCVSHTLTYSPCQKYMNNIQMMLGNITSPLYSDFIQKLLTKTYALKDGSKYIRHFIVANIEAGSEFVPNLLKYVSAQCIHTGVVHPYILADVLKNGSTGEKNVIYSYLKARTNIFKEELIIKTWHPSRLFAWCLDIQDINDMAPGA